MRDHGILKVKEEIMVLKNVMVNGFLKLMQMKEYQRLKKEIINVVKTSKNDWHLVNVKNFLEKKLLGLDGVVILVNLLMRLI